MIEDFKKELCSKGKVCPMDDRRKICRTEAHIREKSLAVPKKEKSIISKAAYRIWSLKQSLNL